MRSGEGRGGKGKKDIRDRRRGRWEGEDVSEWKGDD